MLAWRSPRCLRAPGYWRCWCWVIGATRRLSYRTIVGREAGVTLIVLLLSLKMLELRARRDAFVVFFRFFSRCSHSSSVRSRCWSPSR